MRSLKEECQLTKERERERENERERRYRAHPRERERSFDRDLGRRRSRSRSRGRGRSRSRSRSRNRHRPGSRSRSRSRSRRRSRSRSVEKNTSNYGGTNSNDPESLKSRLFIGNLPTARMTRGELEEMFKPYGKILGTSLLKGYGFIQYNTEREALEAAAKENGSLYKGNVMDVKIAIEGRRGGPGGGGGAPTIHPPPPRERSPVRDPYTEPYRRPAAPRDPYFDPYDPYARRPPPPDPYRDPLYAPPPVARPFRAPLHDIEIFLTDLKYKEYAEVVESRMRRFGMKTKMMILKGEESLPKEMEAVNRIRLPYAVVITPQNEQHRSITLNILHGTPQEHRNMPMDDSLSLLSRNFEEYKKEKEEKEKAAAPPPPRVITPPPAVRAPPPAPAPPVPAPKPNFIPPDQRMKYLLNLLSDSRYLNLLELDEIGDYVSLRRKRILADQEDRGTPAPASSAATPRAQSVTESKENAIAAQQQELQHKIMSILNGSESGKLELQSVVQSQQALSAAPKARTLVDRSYGESSPSPPPSRQLPTSINFDNPNVQKALDNLISSGSLLKNISSSDVDGDGGQSQASYSSQHASSHQQQHHHQQQQQQPHQQQQQQQQQQHHQQPQQPNPQQQYNIQHHIQQQEQAQMDRQNNQQSDSYQGYDRDSRGQANQHVDDRAPQSHAHMSSQPWGSNYQGDQRY